jgi:molybdopterin molybdotransferase
MALDSKLPSPEDVRMKGFRRRADVDAVRRLLDGATGRLATDEIPVTSCAGRVLAEGIIAPVDVPGFRRAAMDGYAIIAEESFGAAGGNPQSLRIAGESLPGRPMGRALKRGQAVRIMTGAPVPGGADAVIPAEETREGDGEVELLAPVTPGKNIGGPGEDVRRGSRVMEAGRRLRPQDAGLLASVGVSPVPVVRLPRVDILVTGDELLPPGTRPSGTLIVDSNSVMLAALVGRDGGLPATGVAVRDTTDAVRAALLATAGDVVLVSGGSSVGKEDHAPRLLAEIGRLAVHGLAMRPASPTGIGFLPPSSARDKLPEDTSLPGGKAGLERPVFLLPGNPVSCLCAYDFFAGPVIRKLGGLLTGWPYRWEELPLARKIISMIGRVDYCRVRIVEGRVEPLAVSGASILSSTVRADGFVVIPGDAEGYAEKETVRVYLYDASASDLP